MSMLTLDHDNRQALLAKLKQPSWLIACLCAQWCNTCTAYTSSFAQLAEKYPEVAFVWIDIEDQADLVGDLDIENFPTLLIQHGQQVQFFGTVLPEIALAERLLQSKLASTASEIAEQAQRLSRQQADIQACNLWNLLQESQ